MKATLQNEYIFIEPENAAETLALKYLESNSKSNLDYVVIKTGIVTQNVEGPAGGSAGILPAGSLSNMG